MRLHFKFICKFNMQQTHSLLVVKQQTKMESNEFGKLNHNVK